MNSLVSETHRLLARSIGEHIELELHLAEGIPAVSADYGQLEQVLVNLVVNARDAMPQGGVLTIETSATELDENLCELHPGLEPGHYIELTVSDTGMGMSKEVTAHVFEPFFTTKRSGEGTGLGLATVYGIATSAGGGVIVYSEEGVGTTFRVYLPALPEAVEAPTPTPDPRAHAGRGETVLVVEDEPAVMKVTTRMLRRNGYTVLEATSGPEALTLARERELHLLLTDSVMPKMSGRDLAAEVHKLRPGLPVLFMSGYSRGVLAHQDNLANADDHALIQKPFTESALLERVRRALDAS
jgi:two-component system, cell cycle sensor histidine kinase and response regulator CckA